MLRACSCPPCRHDSRLCISGHVNRPLLYSRAEIHQPRRMGCAHLTGIRSKLSPRRDFTCAESTDPKVDLAQCFTAGLEITLLPAVAVLQAFPLFAFGLRLPPKAPAVLVVNR